MHAGRHVYALKCCLKCAFACCASVCVCEHVWTFDFSWLVFNLLLLLSVLLSFCVCVYTHVSAACVCVCAPLQARICLLYVRTNKTTSALAHKTQLNTPSRAKQSQGRAKQRLAAEALERGTHRSTHTYVRTQTGTHRGRTHTTQFNLTQLEK